MMGKDQRHLPLLSLRKFSLKPGLLLQIGLGALYIFVKIAVNAYETDIAYFLAEPVRSDVLFPISQVHPAFLSVHIVVSGQAQLPDFRIDCGGNAEKALPLKAVLVVVHDIAGVDDGIRAGGIDGLDSLGERSCLIDEVGVLRIEAELRV